ncbi:MAG: hypothetical protein AAFR76_07975 [Planctomycetota bacterium]
MKPDINQGDIRDGEDNLGLRDNPASQNAIECLGERYITRLNLAGRPSPLDRASPKLQTLRWL